MSLRTFGLALALALPAALGMGPASLSPGVAEASVSVAITLEELVESSACVVVATAHEQRSQWEELGGKRRIVTYTRLTVGQLVTGKPAKELWVRTLGGVVDGVGQLVSGEATLAPGAESLVFLHEISGGTMVVSAMAQGHFPVQRTPNQPARLTPSQDTGKVLARTGPSIAARELLVGQTLGDAVQAIQRVRRAIDEKR
ncbi:hypothetical protein [Chondromyces crocatus]|uniref:Secreted protein n=1 Tax=Chondromyces crocatus TaxID=52 RepID=A0A0K1EK97_CHOCO|nr:hypothetical protein [Chondromyces crocatus]AKT41023.1 uncharacterized protein CMC5_051810 [Chondromyces crocatus]